ncbi:thioesterase II family protein [Streptomyces cinnamoneus]|uniref:thioesterase II family protein n=1 Tax=Streptomyces cinnamoneus TaxID=53446 RepID=UPI001FB179EE|nr:alpha/beta fold hydrolase [Streptomyces cinnamoneus]
MIQQSTTSPWFLRFPQDPACRTRLVCFPHAGGAASYYVPYARALSPEVDVLAVQYPGRQNRYSEAHIEDIGTLADEIAAALEPWLDLPTALFGHSMGAVLAFEVTRRLERRGDFDAARLFVSGCPAPSRRREETFRKLDGDLDDNGVIAELRALSGTNAAVFENEELLRLTLPTIRSDYTAVRNYRAEPGAAVRAPVTVLAGDSDHRTTPDELQAWQTHTTATCDVHTFTGGHFFINDHAGEIVGLITDRLLTV